MTWSLNEIESLSKKAARGAGLNWGIAEEAGKATRWLCAAGWPGADLLADLLTRNDGVPHDEVRPQATTGTWEARGGLLCPLVGGAAMSDLADRWAGGETAHLGPTAFPLLLVPYMAWAADRTGARLELEFDGVRIARGRGETAFDIAGPGAPSVHSVSTVTLRPVAEISGTPLKRAWRGEIGSGATRVLQAFAQRTYAPETEQSRLAGAGAGLTDND